MKVVYQVTMILFCLSLGHSQIPYFGGAPLHPTEKQETLLEKKRKGVNGCHLSFEQYLETFIKPKVHDQLVESIIIKIRILMQYFENPNVDRYQGTTLYHSLITPINNSLFRDHGKLKDPLIDYLTTLTKEELAFYLSKDQDNVDMYKTIDGAAIIYPYIPLSLLKIRLEKNAEKTRQILRESRDEYFNHCLDEKRFECEFSSFLGLDEYDFKPILQLNNQVIQTFSHNEDTANFSLIGMRSIAGNEEDIYKIKKPDYDLRNTSFITGIVIHHTGNDYSIQELNRQFQKKKYAYLPYNFIINLEKGTYYTRPYNVAGGHVKGMSLEALLAYSSFKGHALNTLDFDFTYQHKGLKENNQGRVIVEDDAKIKVNETLDEKGFFYFQEFENLKTRLTTLDIVEDSQENRNQKSKHSNELEANQITSNLNELKSDANKRTLGIAYQMNLNDPNIEFKDVHYQRIVDLICSLLPEFPYLKYITTHRFMNSMNIYQESYKQIDASQDLTEKTCPGTGFDFYKFQELMRNSICGHMAKKLNYIDLNFTVIDNE
jgi:hypothetical protein